MLIHPTPTGSAQLRVRRHALCGIFKKQAIIGFVLLKRFKGFLRVQQTLPISLFTTHDAVTTQLQHELTAGRELHHH